MKLYKVIILIALCLIALYAVFWCLASWPLVILYGTGLAKNVCKTSPISSRCLMLVSHRTKEVMDYLLPRGIIAAISLLLSLGGVMYLLLHTNKRNKKTSKG